MSWLLVPDIHGRHHKFVTQIAPLFAEHDHVIFMGDWFDSFGNPHSLEMCQLIKTYVGDEKFTFLTGNHDAHYRWTNHLFPCSGWKAGTARIIGAHLTPYDWAHFAISTRVGPYLISHAGYHPDTLPRRMEEATAIEMADNGDFHPLFSPGQCRGGDAEIGGPNWLDWDCEFEDIPGQPQIVGHTFQRDLQPKASPNGESFCIDTGLRHLGFIDDEFNFKIGQLEDDGTERH